MRNRERQLPLMCKIWRNTAQILSQTLILSLQHCVVKFLIPTLFNPFDCISLTLFLVHRKDEQGKFPLGEGAPIPNSSRCANFENMVVSFATAGTRESAQLAVVDHRKLLVVFWAWAENVTCLVRCFRRDGILSAPAPRSVGLTDSFANGLTNVAVCNHNTTQPPANNYIRGTYFNSRSPCPPHWRGIRNKLWLMSLWWWSVEGTGASRE